MTRGALIYLIGAPGSGKSTLMAGLTAGCERRHVPKPVGHDMLFAGPGRPVAVELGRSRPGFPGTDTLPMNIAPAAATWVAGMPHRLVLAEGDRLAHMGFVSAAAQAGYTVTLVYLDAAPALLAARCLARGSTQNPAWARGRATKARRLADTAATVGFRVLELDGAEPTCDNQLALRGALPVLNALPEAPQ